MAGRHVDDTAGTVSSRSVAGWRSTVLEMDGAGRWIVDGEAAPDLRGCRDVVLGDD